MLPSSSNSGDDKSQNRDYGSFCNTPSENFGPAVTTAAAAAAAAAAGPASSATDTPTLTKRLPVSKRGGGGAGDADRAGDNSNDSVMNTTVSITF